MEQINELVELAQQIDAVMDDTKSEVFSLHISSRGRTAFLVTPEYMLKNFDNMDVIKTGETGAYCAVFKLETEIEGVIFKCSIYPNELHLLNGRIPEEWLNVVENQKPKEIHRITACRQNDVALLEQEKSPLARACE